MSVPGENRSCPRNKSVGCPDDARQADPMDANSAAIEALQIIVTSYMCVPERYVLRNVDAGEKRN